MDELIEHIPEENSTYNSGFMNKVQIAYNMNPELNNDPILLYNLERLLSIRKDLADLILRSNYTKEIEELFNGVNKQINLLLGT